MCACWTGDVHMLNWRCAHAELDVCTCSTKSMHMIYFKCAHAWPFFTHERHCQKVKIFTSQGTHMHNWKWAHALLQLWICSTQSVQMLMTTGTVPPVGKVWLITWLQWIQVHLLFALLGSLAEYNIIENIIKWKHFHIFFHIVKR